MNELESTLNIVSKLWPIFASIVLIIAWFIKLEVKQLFHYEEFERFRDDTKENEKKVWENIEKIREMQSEIIRTLSRIEGKLDKK